MPKTTASAARGANARKNSRRKKAEAVVASRKSGIKVKKRSKPIGTIYYDPVAVELEWKYNKNTTSFYNEFLYRIGEKISNSLNKGELNLVDMFGATGIKQLAGKYNDGKKKAWTHTVAAKKFDKETFLANLEKGAEKKAKGKGKAKGKKGRPKGASRLRSAKKEEDD